MRCGYVALAGRPNAGKSTLFNALLGQRLSIVTPKPQTTRSRVLGILTRPQSQLIFLDTPGLLEPAYELHRTMERQIDQATRQADVLLVLLDASGAQGRDDLLHKFLSRAKVPVVAVLNKMDLLATESAEEKCRVLGGEFGLEEILPISALRGDNLDILLVRLEECLPCGPKLYPEDMIAQQPERFFAGELIREAAFNHLEEELPYAIAIAIEEFRERPGRKTYISATIYVERDSQKGMVIGQQGRCLHRIGRQARLAIEELIDAPVYLELRVKVRPNWRKREKDLKEFGYL